MVDMETSENVYKDREGEEIECDCCGHGL